MVNHIDRLLVVILLFSAFMHGAKAEGGCPDGYYPIGGGNGGWSGCAPIPGSGGGAYQPRDPGPMWATKWGAIAVDGTTGKFAGIEGLSSERKANKAAIKECRKNGGKQCKVIAAYYNGCGAMAWGDSKVTSYMGPQRQEAIDLAVKSCSKETTNCQAYYAGCSYPVRIR